MPLILLFLACVMVEYSSAYAQPTKDQGYDSPIDHDIAAERERALTDNLSADLHRPAEIPWAYEPSRRVYDYARVLTPANLYRLNTLLLPTTLTLVTMPYRDGEPLFEYAQRIRGQFNQAIPPMCERTPPTVPRSWEETCFVRMPPHDPTRETILVYDPNSKESRVALGSTPLPPDIIAHLTNELKKTRYRRQTALANYRVEPPRIGPFAPWRRIAHIVNPVNPPAPPAEYVATRSAARYPISLLLMSLIFATAYGMIRLYRHYARPLAPRLVLKRRSFTPAFIPAPKVRRYYQRPSP